MYQYGLEKNLTVKKWLVKLMPVFVVLFAVLTGVVYVAGARNFGQAFAYSLLIWMMIELCVTFGFGCGWYTHMKHVQNFGREERTAISQIIPFFVKGILKSIGVGIIVSAMIGGLISFSA